MEEISEREPFRLRLSVNANEWVKPLESHLLHSLFKEDSQTSGNISFVCNNNKKIHWNGLAYLAAMSHLFQARSREEQHFTVMLPDIEVSLLMKLLMLMTTGEARVRLHEVEHLRQLANDLGVSNIQRFAQSFNMQRFSFLLATF